VLQPTRLAGSPTLAAPLRRLSCRPLGQLACSRAAAHQLRLSWQALQPTRAVHQAMRQWGRVVAGALQRTSAHLPVMSPAPCCLWRSKLSPVALAASAAWARCETCRWGCGDAQAAWSWGYERVKDLAGTRLMQQPGRCPHEPVHMCPRACPGSSIWHAHGPPPGCREYPGRTRMSWEGSRRVWVVRARAAAWTAAPSSRAA